LHIQNLHSLILHVDNFWKSRHNGIVKCISVLFLQDTAHSLNVLEAQQNSQSLVVGILKFMFFLWRLPTYSLAGHIEVVIGMFIFDTVFLSFKSGRWRLIWISVWDLIEKVIELLQLFLFSDIYFSSHALILEIDLPPLLQQQSLLPNLANSGLLCQEEQSSLIVLQQNLERCAESVDSLAEVVHVELPPGLLPADMVSPHHFPLPVVEDFDLFIDQIADEDHKVKFVRPERGPVLFGEDAIAQIQFVAIPTVNFEERKKEGGHAEEAADVGKSIIDALKGAGVMQFSISFAQVEVEVDVSCRAVVLVFFLFLGDYSCGVDIAIDVGEDVILCGDVIIVKVEV
jgi:hypothetical protein